MSDFYIFIRNKAKIEFWPPYLNLDFIPITKRPDLKLVVNITVAYLLPNCRVSVY